MKKVLVIGSVLLVAVVIFGTGFFFAQSYLVRAAGLPSVFSIGGMVNGRGGMMGGGRGNMSQIHDYVEQALADKLGMTEAQIEAEQAKGKSLSQIAIDKGTAQADVTTLLTEVHKTALTKAVTDGLLTQAQADAMLQMMTANGFNDGFGGGMMNGGRGGYGQVHTYVEQALADKLGMSLTDLEAAEAKGQTWSQIAISKGTAQADVTALLTEVHKTALAKAVTDGVLTQAQADAMLQMMTANGFNDGFGGGMMNGGRGGGHGRGGMMGGWGQNQQAVPTPSISTQQ